MSLEAAFLATEIHLWRGRTHLVVSAAPQGTTRGSFPAGVTTVHVVTAWNPGGRRSDPTDNARAARELEADLAQTGWELWAAEGWAPDDRWAEESVAVVDGDEARVLDIARRYGQAAIYRWTPTERAVVWTDGRADARQGWEVVEVSPAAGGPTPPTPA